MKQLVVDVTFKKAVEDKKDVTPSTAEVGHGEYRRRFERASEPFTLKGEEEIGAVMNTGLFESVPGSERYEEAAEPKSPAAALGTPQPEASPEAPPSPSALQLIVAAAQANSAAAEKAETGAAAPEAPAAASQELSAPRKSQTAAGPSGPAGAAAQQQ